MDDAIATYQRGKRRLDYIFLSQRLRPALQRSGYLPFGEGLLSNHRCLFLDHDSDNFLHREQFSTAK
jgi:exonuclease III